MKNSDSIREMLMQDYQLQSLSEPSSATPSLQRHPHYNSTWVPLRIIQQQTMYKIDRGGGRARRGGPKIVLRTDPKTHV